MQRLRRESLMHPDDKLMRFRYLREKSNNLGLTDEEQEEYNRLGRLA